MARLPKAATPVITERRDPSGREKFEARNPKFETNSKFKIRNDQNFGFRISRSMTPVPAITVENVSHRYGDRQALEGVGFTVVPGEIFGLLGPNGGGKTTLFRVVSTLLPVQRGAVRLLGLDVSVQPQAVRRAICVTFQSPSLDRKLTVRENLKHQGHLYGLSGRVLGDRIALLLDRLGLTDRARDRVETLSGGLARRVEIAKGLLHEPRVLLLDEPSTGLDPGARIDLWRYLKKLREDDGVTVLVTTHLMEEAERCDRLAILDRGRVVALGQPAELRASIGGDCLTIQSPEPESLAKDILARMGGNPRIVSGRVRLEVPQGHEFLRRLVNEFGPRIETVSLGKPTLEDVFVERTGHRFWDDAESGE
jgi:ABC-2 type transport system ATP-binding protein